jgi:2-dehydro-3-deoxyphosphogluconate aldolase/(4S)-4-hydroxy-2-oxoglutarate aldolase
MKPEQFVEILGAEKASAIIRTSNREVASEAMRAAIRGGFRIVEFTLTTPDALGLVREFSQDDVIAGAGTVLTPQEARASVNAGAKFLVSPVVDVEVIQEANRLGVAIIPGTFTPSEMLKAHRAGASLQKLFPAPPGGPAYVRACLAPLPFLRLVPTNGVDESNAAEYLHAGAFAVGFVAALFDKADLQNRRFDLVEERARRLLRAVRS